MGRRQQAALSVFLVPLLLGACNPDSQTVAKCEFQARKIRPDVGAPMADLMEPCMRAEGYAFNMASDACEPGLSGTPSDSSINPACYQSERFLKIRQSLPDWASRYLKDY